MNATDNARFKHLYAKLLTALKLQGLRPKTIDAYSRAVRRITKHFDCCPDTLTKDQVKSYFSTLVDSHSWSTVKLDRSVNAPAIPTLPPSMAVAMACNSFINTCWKKSGIGLSSLNHLLSKPCPIFFHNLKFPFSLMPRISIVTKCSFSPSTVWAYA